MREATLPVTSGALGRLCVAAAISAAAAACGSSTDTFVGPSPSRCVVQAQTDTSSFTATGGAGTVRISANRECAWSAQADATWVALQAQPSGQGDGTVQFTVAANGDPSSRSGGISINDQRLQITQQGSPCQYHLSSTRETVDPEGGKRTVHVESGSTQCQWSADADVPWISIESGKSGSGSGDVVFEVDAVVGPPRTGTLTIAGAKVAVEQGTGCTYATAVTTLAVGSAGGTGEVPVSAPAGCTWTAESQTPWITLVSGASGAGPGKVVVRAAPTDGPSRTGTLVAAGRTITVTQSSGCAVSVEPLSQSVPAGASTGSISVRSNPSCAWSASSNTSWLSISSGGSGAGDAQVQFAAAANTGPARSGTLTIGGFTVTISQANGCSYGVSPQDILVSAAGQTGPVDVATGAGCPWRAASDSSWITVTPASATGPGQVTFGVGTNAGPPRSATLTIAGRMVAFSQASACTWALSSPPYDMDPAGGRGFVEVTVGGPCAWIASSTAIWITLEAAVSGTGSGFVHFIVAPNPGPARSGIIRIGHLEYVVRQGGR